MQKNRKRKNRQSGKTRIFPIILGVCLFGTVVFAVVYYVGQTDLFSTEYKNSSATASAAVVPPKPTLDFLAYDQKLDEIAHVSTSTVIYRPSSADWSPYEASSTDASRSLTSSVSLASSTSTLPSTLPTLDYASLPFWPVQTVYPNYGAILPFSRIVAYYGNFYSTSMGVLGQYPAPQMLAMLASTTAQWQAADPSTPVIPALDYIAVTAQGSPGPDGMYRLRMPASQIDEAISLAGQINGLVFLDVQVGLSDLQTEIPLLAPYLKLPQVELAVDPEFAMHNGAVPGTVIGSLDASDINFAANYLADIVRENDLPPKILVVHRFTEDMVTNYQKIQPLPEVQILMDMDGWGIPAKKIQTYTDVIYDEPVQFTGLKLFYKNDLLPPSTRLMTPAEILKLTPAPLFIQYQ